MRREAPIDAYLGRLETIYAAAIDAYRNARADPAAELRFEAAFWQQQARYVKEAAQLREKKRTLERPPG